MSCTSFAVHTNCLPAFKQTWRLPIPKPCPLHLYADTYNDYKALSFTSNTSLYYLIALCCLYLEYMLLFCGQHTWQRSIYANLWDKPTLLAIPMCESGSNSSHIWCLKIVHWEPLTVMCYYINSRRGILFSLRPAVRRSGFLLWRGGGCKKVKKEW